MRLSGFEGTVALVTGAGGGIGAALVRLLRASGSVVVATDLLAPALAAQAEAPAAHAAALDVADAAAVDALVERVEREIGPIGFGVNVAGVLQSGTIDTIDDAEWRRVFAVNADGVFHVSRALARVMKPRRRGALVTVSSNAAGVPRHGMAAYAASKAAATMFTRCLGLELAPLGIRCNIVAPGSTLTPMQTGMWTDGDGARRVIAGLPEIYKAGIPLGKLATPEDIAGAVMFLLSEQAGHIAMSDLYVDGGATLRA
ncbi:MAG: 2,3-dihydro-2,3-dihydroxybenzoate dehydrogenase [Candidatus Dactylopiibacterium carminicum]|uniref:2,3-dihydro-2,3-dihydroxybenzoate dehydrogenase n=1 Tax=Candidatus Dactylopiibacterium carminicum TaxID=857335 RepID=A0A272EXU7_9RHOO|nr:2,3-dihydro-2,3-dihydroxybenzoate dehydrogenase [Candidatus Dactylopiibacterium carminicum]KAF7600490.1 2,3-dihydro-2,3-dihydroxybenzoate dehydrogenase [Candidatus Dactylopiibacterium carminicum]PAS94942.1 MAG: 2,3-dihydro-2,3-dihydroxybenzoate dehydrogenase [Candidatus Dactylopiibacterium carminicum]PAS98077.1 MAG: 2,3-dihydro-2,3-dihydroxybenzoate dehydrogenase [Candidatus Dactylopiibacterium carminicum]PAT00493.1 MAG: 2,3-dihydro-2,3-dihydroxybenzoate dehydrogenase [Candidatus Dactylopiib